MPPALAAKLLGLTFAAFIIFGLTLGSFSFNEQLWAAPLKIRLIAGGFGC
jgi:hypothetical protein